MCEKITPRITVTFSTGIQPNATQKSVNVLQLAFAMDDIFKSLPFLASGQTLQEQRQF